MGITNLHSSNGRNVVVQRIQTCAVVIVAVLLATSYWLLSSRFSDFRLANYARSGNTNLLADYLRSGCDINTLLRYSSHPTAIASLLHLAVGAGNLECVRFLLTMGADPNCKDDIDRGPIMWVVGLTQHGVPLERRLEILDLLLNEGADPNKADYDGNTALIWASEFGIDKMVTLLLRCGASVNAANRNGFTALHLADNERIARALLEAGADEHLIASTGESPFATAIREKRYDVASVLSNRSSLLKPGQ